MSSKPESQTVFGANYASVYDSLYLEKDYVRECDLFEQAVAAVGRPSRILDVGCGTGGHSIELARRGHDVTGVDMSPAMIEIAQRKAVTKFTTEQLPQFLCGRAADFNVQGQSFDAAMMMFAVLGYLRSNNEVISSLCNINKHLKTGGLFVCDFWWGPAVLTQRPGERVRVVETPSGKTVRATRTSLETMENLAHVHFDIIRAEGAGLLGQSRETHTMRYFFGPELHLLFEQSGFEIVQMSPFPDTAKKLDDASWNAMIVAKKNLEVHRAC